MSDPHEPVERLLFDFFEREMPESLRRSTEPASIAATSTRPATVTVRAHGDVAAAASGRSGRIAIAVATACVALSAALPWLGSSNGPRREAETVAPSAVRAGSVAEPRTAPMREPSPPGGPVESRIQHVGAGDDPSEPRIETELPELLIEVHPIDEAKIPAPVRNDSRPSKP